MNRLQKVLCLVLMMGGCVMNGQTIPDSAPTEAIHAHRGQVVLIRGGVFGIFSHGLDDLAAELREAGLDVSVYPHGNWQELTFDLTGRSDGVPLIVVGHSWGAVDALDLARDLKLSGDQIDLLVTLDTTQSRQVPSNVKQAWNVYQSNGPAWRYPWFRGHPLPGRATDHPPVENTNLWLDPNDLHEPDLTHWNLTSQPRLQTAIVQRILSICPLNHD